MTKKEIYQYWRIVLIYASFLISLIILVLLAQGQNTCGGTYRWKIKTMTDSLSNQVNLTPQSVNIKDLIDAPRPINVESSDSYRIIEEMKVVSIQGRIIYWKVETDKDIHLVMKSDSSIIVCEIPNTRCKAIKVSRVLNQIRKARQKFMMYETFGHKMKPGVYQVTGVIFYDKLHNLSSIGSNNKGVELHPVIGFTKIN